MMKTTSRFFFVLPLLLIFGSTASQAQLSSLDTLKKKFNSFRTNNYQEKIYVHTDQDAYLTGEILWYSAYLVDGTFHRFSDVSTVAYLEIVDRENKPIAQSKIEIKNGKGSGSIYLSPVVIQSGNYLVRAYTNWMKNSLPDFYFQKSITIVNTFEPLDKKKVIDSSLPNDAQFFPEGGNLVAGISNKVGFRVIAPNGKGVSFKGTLLNANNDTLMHFSPFKFGIGNFSFQPEAGVAYHAVLKDHQNKTQIVNLPEVMPTGYALKVTDSLDRFIVRVQAPAIANSTFPVYLFIHARNQVTHAEASIVGPQGVDISIRKADMAEGISHVTLFDQQLQPVCERLVFRQPTKYLEIQAIPGQNQYGLRRPANLTIASAPSSRLSVSVYKTDSLNNAKSSSILEYLWLTADLKGNVESPEYYLSEPSAAVNTAIDNLMLTHGWRRFNWRDILEKKHEPVKHLAEIYGHIITGQVVDENGNPAADIVTYLASPSRSSRVHISRSNKNGKVHFTAQDYFGNRKLYGSTNYRTQDSVYQIKIASPFSSDFATNTLSELTLSPTHAEQLTNRSMAMQVSDVFHRDHQEIFKNPSTDTTAFFGKPDEFFKLDEFTRFPVMEEVMREYVPGVVVRKRKDGFHFMVLNDGAKGIFSETPFMLIDGVPFFDEDEIMRFDPKRIKTLAVMRRKYHLGLQAFPGLVSFTTYTGDLSGFQVSRHNVVLDYEGLQLQREFYTPRYETQKQRESRIPDQRYLLYWNPSVVTDAQGKAELSFFTSDIQGKYQVVVEGMDENGSAGSSAASFDVKAFNN